MISLILTKQLNAKKPSTRAYLPAAKSISTTAMPRLFRLSTVIRDNVKGM